MILRNQRRGTARSRSSGALNPGSRRARFHFGRRSETHYAAHRYAAGQRTILLSGGGHGKSFAIAAVIITAQGEAFENPDFLTVTFLGPSNQSLRSLTIDVANSGLFFDLQPTETNPGYSLGTLMGLRPSDVTLLNGTQSGPSLSFSFTPGAFKSGDSFSFVAGAHSIYPAGIGDAADFLAPQLCALS